MKFPLISQVFAADNPFGSVKSPLTGTGYKGALEGGLTTFLTNILSLVFVAAGIYAFINFIIAGYQYMTAGGDAKALAGAWNRIWQTLLGLVLLVGSFALAALIGYVVFGRADYILNPVIYGPK